MSRVRKFYLKSKLNFGKYRGKTVKEVVDMGEGPYLRWCNERMNKITFAKECKRYWGLDCPIGHSVVRYKSNFEDDENYFDDEDWEDGSLYGDSDPNDPNDRHF